MTHTVIRIHDFSLISHLIHSQLSYLRQCATLSGFQLSISHTKNPVPQKPDPYDIPEEPHQNRSLIVIYLFSY